MQNGRILAIALLFSLSLSYGQCFDRFQLGLVVDHNEYALVRSGQSSDSPILDTIPKGEFFRFTPNDTSQWVETFKMWNVQGFVHRSQVASYEDFSRAEMTHMVDSIFDMGLMAYHTAGRAAPLTMMSSKKYYDEKFKPVLDWFTALIEERYDDSLTRKFFKLLELESPKPDDSPSWAMGSIYLAHPHKVRCAIKEANNQLLVDNLEFGFMNVTFDRKYEIADFETLEYSIKELRTPSERF